MFPYGGERISDGKEKVEAHFASWKPATLDQRRVFRFALAAAKKFAKRKKMYERVADTDFAGKIILFRMLSTGGNVAKGFLEEVGCPDVVYIDDENDLYEIASTIPVRGLIFWYSLDDRGALPVMHRLLADRNIPRIPILLLCPGEAAVKAAKENSAPVHYDLISVLPPSRLEFSDMLEKWLTALKNPSSPRAQLEQIRGGDSAVLWAKGSGDDMAEAIEKLAAGSSRFSFWATEEKILSLLRRDCVSEAMMVATGYMKDYGEQYLTPRICLARVLARSEGTGAAAKWLFKGIRSFGLNQQEAIRVGHLLIEWRNLSALKVFLNFWHDDDKLVKGHMFAYFVGYYWGWNRDYQSSHHYFKYAIQNSPFRWDFLYAMVKNRLKLSDFRVAEHYLIVAKNTPWINELDLAVGFVQVHYGLRRIRKGDSMLKRLLDRYPDDERLIAIKKKYVDSRVMDKSA